MPLIVHSTGACSGGKSVWAMAWLRELLRQGQRQKREQGRVKRVKGKQLK